MTRPLTLISLGALVFAFGCVPVRAADDAALAKAMFADPAPNAKSRACFVRRYDRAHMAAHPRQTVADMMLLVSRESYRDGPGLRYQFQLSMHFAHRKGRFESSSDCSQRATGENQESPATRIFCPIACDGGDIAVTPSLDSRTALAQVDHLRVWRPGSQFEGMADGAIEGDEDKALLLERVELSACAPLLPEAERVKMLSRKK
jgi:hypothetical protein